MAAPTTTSATPTNVNTDRGNDKRTYSSPLEADVSKMARVQNSDGSFSDFMNGLSPVQSGMQGQPQQAQPVATYHHQGQHPGTLPPPARYAHQQPGPYQVPQYQPPRFPAAVPGQPRPMAPPQQHHQHPITMANQIQHTSMTSTPVPQQPVQYTQAGAMTPDSFAMLLANALKTPQVIDSMGSIVHDRLEALTEDYERRLRELESKNLQLQLENTSLHQRLGSAESAIDELEQYGRRNALRISNTWAEVDGESTDDMVVDLAINQLGVDLHLNDISRSHRVGPKRPGQPRPVLVKFSTYRARERVYRARSQLKNTLNNTYINEDLTKKRGSLAYSARQLKKSRQVQDTWTYDCRVFVKNNAGTVRVVSSIIELEDFSKQGTPEHP